MYGLVNRAIEGMGRGGHGEAVWNRVRERAGVQVEVFVSTDPYPDDVTYRLVAAASEELAMPPDEILKGFGEYWVLHTAVEAYGPMLRMAGRTLRDFLPFVGHPRAVADALEALHG